jgi:hypothetical protein
MLLLKYLAEMKNKLANGNAPFMPIGNWANLPFMEIHLSNANGNGLFPTCTHIYLFYGGHT